MDLRIKVDGMVFTVGVEPDDDGGIEIESLFCEGKDASFLMNSDTLFPLIEAEAWDEYISELIRLDKVWAGERAAELV